MNAFASRLTEALDVVAGQLDLQPIMANAVDWLIGQDYPDFQSEQWLENPNDRARDAAPILKLNAAILAQAVSDHASRIELRTGVPEVEYPGCETLEQYERRIEDENPNSEAAKIRAKFMQIMAEAGVSVNPERPAAMSKLTVVYYFGDYPFIAMAIPPDLLGPCIRAYPYAFNFRRCSTVARPENILYVSTEQRAAFASITHYDPKSNHLVGICLEYED